MSLANPKVLLFDGVLRRIYLKSGVTFYHPIDDIYTEYRQLRRTDENFRKFWSLIRAEGKIPKGGGKFTSRFLVLLEGTKIVPFDDGLGMDQTGEIITDDPDVDPEIYDTSGLTQPKPIFIAPANTEIIEVSTGGGSNGVQLDRIESNTNTLLVTDISEAEQLDRIERQAAAAAALSAAGL